MSDRNDNKLLHYEIDAVTDDYKWKFVHAFETGSQVDSFVAVPSRNIMMLFIRNMNNGYIYIYSTITNKWNLSELKLTKLSAKKDRTLVNFRTVFDDRKEKYVTILGGYQIQRMNKPNDIYCID